MTWLLLGILAVTIGLAVAGFRHQNKVRREAIYQLRRYMMAQRLWRQFAPRRVIERARVETFRGWCHAVDADTGRLALWERMRILRKIHEARSRVRGCV